MKSKTVFWIVVAIASGLYALMLIWSLPKITALANGQLLFDLRPGGYSFEEAKAFLSALTPEGKDFYLNVQQKLDTAFPAFEALAVGWSIVLLCPAKWGVWRYVLAAPIFIGAVFDYLENAASAAMLKVGADGITSEMVATASNYTVMKSVFVSIGLTILLVMIVVWFIWRHRSKK